MADILVKIKRAVLRGNYIFSEKARLEMELNRITDMDVVESIINAVAIYKKLRSTRILGNKKVDYLYIIQSPNLDGMVIYTKGKLMKDDESEKYYFIISSKRTL